jgi:hypothetical protein
MAAELLRLEETRVPLAIPVGIAGLFAGVQIFLGTNPLLALLCLACIAVPLVPLHLYGRDLYAILGIIFCVRYVGVALIAKTLYGQTLETNLYDPFAAYGLTLLLMVTVTFTLLLARALDARTTLCPFPMEPASLRRLALLALAVGFVSETIIGLTKSSEAGGLNSGAVFILAANFAGFFIFGLIAEVIHNITKSDRRTFLSPLLMLSLMLALGIAIGLNQREFFISCILAVIMTAFIYKMIRVQHIIAGLVIFLLFWKIMTPITLFLRNGKEGMDLPRFLHFAQTTLVRAATEPGFFNDIANEAKTSEWVDPNDLKSNDYFGDGSNVLNRLSYVSLLDAVYNGTRSRAPIGKPAIDQSIARVAPGFLGFDKNVTRYGFGDWFAWQIGLYKPESLVFANFGLPMEGLATWGLAGFIAYPILFLLPVLYICARISSFLLPLPASVFILADIHHRLIETMSDGYIVLLTRSLPLFAVSLFALYKLFGLHSAPPKSGPVVTSH